MSITPVNPIAAAQAAPVAAERVALAQAAAEIKPAAEGKAAESPASRRDELEQLRALAHAANMELKVLDLPDDRVVLFRLVESESGRVVREFPSEDLTRQLASLRALRLDERA